MSRPKILVIDDDKELSELVKVGLEDAGYEVFLAADGDEGVKIARELKPDLVVLDVFLPRKDGFTVMKELKSPARNSHTAGNDTRNIPVIVITGRAPMMEDMFRIEGAADFLIKPVDIKALIGKIEKVLEKK
ncbi:MAG: response regulator [Candidatus Omnitrophica bacterium]|nr:response regulator [Candidatus Omnitrophota bacterium]